MLFAASLAVAFGMAWAIGAQDVSNALGTSVGSKALTVRQATILAGICEFLGSMTGGQVAATISGGVLNIDAFRQLPNHGLQLYAFCMFCTMCGAFAWLVVATFFSLPVSTTHSLVGALVGVGLLVQTHCTEATVQWASVARIVSSWATSPILGGLIAYAVFSVIYKNVLKSSNPVAASARAIPYFTSMTAGVLAAFLLVVGPSSMRLAPSRAMFAGLLTGVACWAFIAYGSPAAAARHLKSRASRGVGTKQAAGFAGVAGVPINSSGALAVGMPSGAMAVESSSLMHDSSVPSSVAVEAPHAGGHVGVSVNTTTSASGSRSVGFGRPPADSPAVSALRREHPLPSLPAPARGHTYDPLVANVGPNGLDCDAPPKPAAPHGYGFVDSGSEPSSVSLTSSGLPSSTSSLAASRPSFASASSKAAAPSPVSSTIGGGDTNESTLGAVAPTPDTSLGSLPPHLVARPLAATAGSRSGYPPRQPIGPGSCGSGVPDATVVGASPLSSHPPSSKSPKPGMFSKPAGSTFRRAAGSSVGLSVSGSGNGQSLSDAEEGINTDSGSSRSRAVAAAEAKFLPLMVVTAAVLSFAHGSNDVSNAVGPFSAIAEIFMNGSAPSDEGVPTWVLLCGAVGIVIGLATYGYRVMATVGEKISKLTFSRGYAAQIATSVTVLTSSQLGVSVSTTHCLIGAIAGVALVEGPEKLNKATLKRIFVSWIVTVPAAAAFALFFYTALTPLFLSTADLSAV